jgi:hypothetical protein
MDRAPSWGTAAAVLALALGASSPVAYAQEAEMASDELTLEIAALAAVHEDCTTTDWTGAMLFFDGAALIGLASYAAADPVFADATVNDTLIGLSIGMSVLSLAAGTVVAAGVCRANRPLSDNWSRRPRTRVEAEAYRRALEVRGSTFSTLGASSGTANRDWPIFVFFLHAAAAMGTFLPLVALREQAEWLGVVTTGVLLSAVVYGVVSLGQQISQASNRAWARRRLLEDFYRTGRLAVVPVLSPTTAGLAAAGAF